MDAVIVATDLRMSYGDKRVLDGVSFSLARGEVVALLGPNGAGKTTTIEILEGFRARSAGDVSVLGIDPVTGDEDWRARLGVVLQSWRDHGRWKVRELLQHFGRYYTPYSTAERVRPYDVDELLDMVGLAGHATAKVMSLSGGQRRRLDVALGIVGRPELLFLDEPTVGFDPVARRDFHDLVHRLSDLEGTSILLTTHDQGRIVADGSADALAKEVAGATEIRWSQGGQRHVHTAVDGTAFVRDLLRQHPDGITELEVERSTLEDTYLAMVAKHAIAETMEGASA